MTHYNEKGFSSVILLWIIVIGCFAALVTALVDERISIAIVGIIFVITGCAAIAVKDIIRKEPVVLLLPVAGLVMTIIPIYLMLSEYNPETFPPISGEARKMFWGALAVIAGLCMIVFTVMSRVRLKRRCTCEVNAVCIDIDERRSRGIKCYAPKWEYYVKGQMYTHQEMASSLKREQKIGDNQTIMVNLDDPKEIYRRESNTYLTFVIIGLCLVFAGGIILSLY